MNLQSGNTGDAVKLLQTLLLAAGYSVGPSGVDGIFGPDTMAGVQAFQTANGLPVSGIVDPATAAVLGIDLSTGGAVSTAQATGGSTWSKYAMYASGAWVGWKALKFFRK